MITYTYDYHRLTGISYPDHPENNVENGHVYTYDKNRNLVYVNTSRMMTGGHKDNSVGERKLIWDEENRLLSVDDNGFVSNYWYDADGERTIKTSGESDQVHVNGVFSSGSTNFAFSIYQCVSRNK